MLDIHVLNQACILGVNPTVVMVSITFNVLLNLACEYFVDDFCVGVHQGYWSAIFCSIFIWLRFNF